MNNLTASNFWLLTSGILWGYTCTQLQAVEFYDRSSELKIHPRMWEPRVNKSNTKTKVSGVLSFLLRKGSTHINSSFRSFKVHTPYFCRTNIPHGAGIDHQAGHFLCQASLPSPPGKLRAVEEDLSSAWRRKPRGLQGFSHGSDVNEFYSSKSWQFHQKIVKQGGGWHQFGSHPDDWYPTQSKQQIITETYRNQTTYSPTPPASLSGPTYGNH